MKKKILVLLLTVACMLSCSACAGKEESKTDSNAEKETDVINGGNIADTGMDKEDAGNVVQKSKIGYSVTYDSALFDLKEEGDTDIFTYTAESLDAPVYISVQSYPDKDMETLAEGLVLQSGMDGVKAEEAYFGADNMKTKNVYIEKEVEGVKQTQVFYAIPAGEGSLLVEIGGYVGMPEKIEGKFEEMLGTFSLKAE